MNKSLSYKWGYGIDKCQSSEAADNSSPVDFSVRRRSSRDWTLQGLQTVLST